MIGINSLKIIFVLFFLNSFLLQARYLPLGFGERISGVPTAILPDDRSVDKGDVITISGADSFDPEEDDLTFRWSFDITPEGSNSKIDDPTAEEISFTADMEGLYLVKLVVNDGASNSYPTYYGN